MIIPASFASDDIAINSSQDLSICDESIDFTLTDDASQGNAIYVDSSRGTDNGTGSEDNPVKTIEDGLNLVKTNGTLYLTGEFSGKGNTNLTLNGSIDNVNFIGANDATINGNFTTSFILIENGTYTFNKISFINHFKTEDENTFG